MISSASDDWRCRAAADSCIESVLWGDAEEVHSMMQQSKKADKCAVGVGGSEVALRSDAMKAFLCCFFRNQFKAMFRVIVLQLALALARATAWKAAPVQKQAIEGTTFD